MLLIFFLFSDGKVVYIFINFSSVSCSFLFHSSHILLCFGTMFFKTSSSKQVNPKFFLSLTIKKRFTNDVKKPSSITCVRKNYILTLRFVQDNYFLFSSSTIKKCYNFMSKCRNICCKVLKFANKTKKRTQIR